MLLRDARAGLQSIASELRQRPDGLVDLASRPSTAVPSVRRLLGSFDPLLHGWGSRAEVLGAHQGIVTTNGIFRPFVLLDGRAVGTWRVLGGAVELTPFGKLPRRAVATLAADAADVGRFLGMGSLALTVVDHGGAATA